METLKIIETRRSIRQYTDRKVTDDQIQTVLNAAMCAPSCVNARDWDFIVVRDRELLNKMADANGRPAEPLRTCSFAVLVCGNTERSFKPAPDYWVIDCAAAIENMLLAACDLGFGGVWLGTWPQMNRVESQRTLFGLPETVIPHSIVSFGYPAETHGAERPRYDESRVHFEKW